MGWSGRIALGLLVLVLALEGGLRVLIGESSRWNVLLGAHKMYDPVLQFRNRPHYELAPGNVTNELGYEAPDGLRPEKPAGQLRLLYLGDSNTATPYRESYPAQVEKLLEAEGLRVETVNAAVPGYTSEHARLMLETELSRFDGDYLFVYLGWNDLFHHGPEALPLARMARAGYELNPLQRALTHVYTVRLLYAAQVLRSKYEPTVDEPLDEREDALYGGYEPRHFYDHVRAILRLAKERYPHVYLMTMATVTNDAPTAAELRKAHFPRGMDKNMRKLDVLVAAYNEAIRTLGREEGVPILDFEALFEGREARGGLLDSCHFNHEGAARAARLVADEVLAREREQPSAAGALAR